MRIHAEKVAAGITVELAAGVEHHRGNLNGRCAKCPDAIELLFRADKVAAMDRYGAGSVVIAGGVVVRWVAIEEAVGYILVNTLRLPEAVGGFLRSGQGGKRNQNEDCQTARAKKLA